MGSVFYRAHSFFFARAHRIHLALAPPPHRWSFRTVPEGSSLWPTTDFSLPSKGLILETVLLSPTSHAS